ncbi:MAG: Chromosome partition protein Smc [Verrucomicrobiota bacterium]|jgi:hypothetical protein
MKRACLPALLPLLILPAAPPAPAQDKVTFNDHLLPLLEQHCANCHNPDKKKGDLVLTSHGGLLKGGGSGTVVVSGNPDASKLWKTVTHAEEPTMPPNKPKLADKDLEVIRKWIAGGLLESSGSKAVAAAKPAVDLSLKVSDTGRPEGPPPMPGELSLDPVLHTGRGGIVGSLASSPWAPVVALAGQKQVLLYHPTNLALLGILPFPEGQPLDLKFSRSGKLLLAAGGHAAKSGRVALWNLQSGERLATLGQEYDAILAADLSPDQSRVALGGPSRLVKLHATRTGELEHSMKKHTDWVTAVAFSPNGEFLATADRNGGVVLWDADSGQELFTTAGHRSAVTSLTWRDDSRLVASGSEDGSIKIWETSEGKQARTWAAHAAGVTGLAYARDGRLVSCGRDGTITLWTADGNRTRNLEFDGELAVRCLFSHDGTRVVASDFAGRVAVWDTATGRRLGSLDANPPPLAGQLAAAERRLAALQSNSPAAAPPGPEAAAAATLARLQSEATTAQAAADRAKADFLAKAAEVVRLKALSTGANPPADIEARLAAARAAREAARPLHTNTTVTLAARTQALEQARGKAGAKAAAPAPDPAAALAAARAEVERLRGALGRSALFRARETLALRKREVQQLEADQAAAQAAVAKHSAEAAQAADAGARTRARAALKDAQAGVKTAEETLRQARAAVTAAQAQVDRLAGAMSQTRR